MPRKYCLLKKNVLRGLHFQSEPKAQSKIITVYEGEILDVVVDISRYSKTYGKHYSIKLSSKSDKSLFIPKGFAHGYLTVSNYAVIGYKVDNYYDSNYEFGIAYDDPKINIDWGIESHKVIVSEKDKKQKLFLW